MIKTAGTTLNYIFRNNYKYNYVAVNKEFTQKKLKRLLSINKNIKVISGHSLRSNDLYQLAYLDIKYITFFRNPIDRYISHFNHSKLLGANENTLEERLKNIGENDYQTKFVLGAKNLRERNFVAGVNELRKAKKIIKNDYTFVGLVEKFDDSLVLMKKILNIEDLNIRYEKKNVSQKNENTNIDLKEHIKKEIIEANKIDYQLHKFVSNEIFNLQIEKYGMQFQEDLKNFKNENNNYKFSKLNLFKYRLANKLLYKILRLL